MDRLRDLLGEATGSLPKDSFRYFLMKQLANSSTPVRATQDVYDTPEEAHAAIINYMQVNYPYHRWLESRTPVGDWYRGYEGYVKGKDYKDGDWIDEEVIGWVWIEREEGSG